MQAQAISSKQRSLIFVNLVITCVASFFLATALTVALAPMCSELHVSVATGQWLTSAYSLVLAIVTPLSAYLITTIPTRRLYLGGLAVMIVGLIVSILSPNFIVLMGARVLQAIGGGLVGTMGQIVLLSIYPREKHGSVMGIYGLAMAFSPIIAPTVSGIIIDIAGWRMVFGITLLIALISFAFACVVFRDVLPISSKSFDVVSFVFSGIAFGGITLGIGNLSVYGVASPYALVPLVAGIIGMVIFVKRQFAMETPFLDLHVLQNRTFVICAISSCILFFVMVGSTTLIPVYCQTVLGFSATVAGLILLPGSFLNALASLVAGKVYDKYGIRRLFIPASIMLLISTVGMVMMNDHSSAVFISCIMIICSASIGAMMMPFVSWGMSELSMALTPHGTAMLATLRNIAGAVGTAVLLGIMGSFSAIAPVGTHPQVFGARIAFGVAVVFAIVLVLMALFFTGNKKE